MKKLALVVFGLLASVAATPAHAGIYYDLQQATSSATLRMVGALKMYASSFASTPVVQIDQTGFSTTQTSTFTATGNATYSVVTSSGVNVQAGGVLADFFKATTRFVGNLVGNVTGNLTGNVTGNADTATALAADGSNCSAGSYPLGVSAAGAAQNCTAAGIGDAVLNSTQTWSGTNTHYGTETMAASSTFTISIPARSSGTFSLTQLTMKSLPSGWVVFSATGTLTIQNSMNVSSVTAVATGRYRVNWAVPMLTDDYPCFITIGSENGVTGGTTGDLDFGTLSSGQRKTVTDVLSKTVAGNLEDHNRVHVMCFGGAEAASPR